jgi:hypothetical protein
MEGHGWSRGAANFELWILDSEWRKRCEGDSAELSDSFKIQHLKLKIELNRQGAKAPSGRVWIWENVAAVYDQR